MVMPVTALVRDLPLVSGHAEPNESIVSRLFQQQIVGGALKCLPINGRSSCRTVSDQDTAQVATWLVAFHPRCAS